MAPSNFLLTTSADRVASGVKDNERDGVESAIAQARAAAGPAKTCT